MSYTTHLITHSVGHLLTWCSGVLGRGSDVMEDIYPLGSSLLQIICNISHYFSNCSLLSHSLFSCTLPGPCHIDYTDNCNKIHRIRICQSQLSFIPDNKSRESNYCRPDGHKPTRAILILVSSLTLKNLYFVVAKYQKGLQPHPIYLCCNGNNNSAKHTRVLTTGNFKSVVSMRTYVH